MRCQEDIYRRTAVLLVPSIWSEAFGLVAVEAQLLGIPVVSSALDSGACFRAANGGSRSIVVKRSVVSTAVQQKEHAG